jgi:hypothetical protein
MTTATSTTKRRKVETPVPSFAELIQLKMKERIEQYRGYVARAASGEELPEAELGLVLELLEAMHLPDFAWARDIQAIRNYQDAKAAEEKLTLERPDDAARAKELQSRLKQLEEEMTAVRGELFTLVDWKPSKLVDVMRRQHELEAEYPHVLADVGLAVGLRVQAVERARSLPAKRQDNQPVGWST